MTEEKEVTRLLPTSWGQPSLFSLLWMDVHVLVLVHLPLHTYTTATESELGGGSSFPLLRMFNSHRVRLNTGGGDMVQDPSFSLSLSLSSRPIPQVGAEAAWVAGCLVAPPEGPRLGDMCIYIHLFLRA